MVPETQERFAVKDPSTGGLIALVPDCDAEVALGSITPALAAQFHWRHQTAFHRAEILHRWRLLIEENVEALAEILTIEQGKPIAEAVGEIRYGMRFIEWFAEEGKRCYGDLVPATGQDRRALVLRQPVGLVGAITPWNFPNAMVTRKVAPALAAGCAIILKPAEDTPLSSLALAVLARRAGIPEGLFTVLPTARPAGVGGVLTSHPDIRKISFTGSTPTGQMLMAQAASHVKRMSLELGGNAPFIVFDDADLDLAVATAMQVKFRNGGQTCVSANRFIVHSSVSERFTAKLAEAVLALRVGDGLDGASNIGPLINEKSVSKVSRLVSQARDQGADVLVGGHVHSLGGNFFEPTLLVGVRADMAIWEEEIFGPVVTVCEFTSEEEAVSIGNGTPYGLAAYFFASNMDRIWRVSEALDFGMIGINEGLSANEATPFGGVKHSGVGREGSRYGLDEYTELKYLSLGGIGRPLPDRQCA